jgi:hypothetical protein
MHGDASLHMCQGAGELRGLDAIPGESARAVTDIEC